ncbi:MAG TPA: SMI1/KNR4 family protein [Polyangia bacterium]|jgi:hypothetical protein
MVRFVECDPPASDEEIDDLEQRVALRFPAALRRLFREANGGRPEPYIYGDTDVSECLALRSGKGSAEWTYDLLVASKQLVPRHFFRFAVDSGGNTFLVDCSSDQGMVFLWVHDTADERLLPLDVSLEEFWSCLTER